MKTYNTFSLFTLITLPAFIAFSACNNGSTNNAIQNNNTSGNSNMSADSGVTAMTVGNGQIVITEPIPTDADLDPPAAPVAQTPEAIPMPPARTTADARFRRREPGAGRTAAFVTPTVQQFALNKRQNLTLMSRESRISVRKSLREQRWPA